MNHIVKSKVIIFKASWSSKTPFSMCLQRASKKLSREWKLGHIVYFVLHIYIWECHRVVLGVIWIQTTFHLYAHWLSWGKHPCLNRSDQGKSSYRISSRFTIGSNLIIFCRPSISMWTSNTQAKMWSPPCLFIIFIIFHLLIF